jgi:hypothetical protein
MTPDASRRTFLRNQSVLALGLAAAAAGTARAVPAPRYEPDPEPTPDPWPGFPQQDPTLAREIVGASHGNIKRVRELLQAHPALSKATYDWGYGDWESALGAASHVGNRDIAALLLDSGARLDIFAAAMLGMTDVVKAILVTQPALAHTRGPHGIPLLAHASAGKNGDLVAFLKTIDGAGEDAAMPLTPEGMQTYIGAYARDSGGSVIVSQTRFGMAIKAEGGIDRGLTRTGEHTFHPAGAPNVRVSFTVKDGVAGRVEIAEDVWLVSAVRKL